MRLKKIFFSVSLVLCIEQIQCQSINKSEQKVRKFPDGFLFGAASSAYQTEGAWNEDGKTESIWDHLTHTHPDAVSDGSNADVTTDSYHQYQRDVQMIRELGLDSYRFSIPWTRVLNNSFDDQINQAGVDHYNNLINELLEHHIEPIVTIYHWDLPQKLQQMGGWTNPYIVNWFGDYARVIYKLFGDRVKKFITVNEPYQICVSGYGGEANAPMVNIEGIAEYLCAKNLLLAHAHAWHIYNNEFRSEQGGIVFLTVNCEWSEPATQNETDIEAAYDSNMFYWGIFTYPIFSKTGDYPQVVKDRIAKRSAEQDYPRSRLPALTPQEVDYIRGSSDAFGLNHYSSFLATRNESVIGYYSSPSFLDDLGIILYQNPEWKLESSDVSVLTPWGLTKVLLQIKEWYDNPPVYITENGCATSLGYKDEDRITYITSYLGALLDAVDSGCDVRAYTIWSLMDSFEWMSGYTMKYGLYEVDFNSTDRTRRPRMSASVYKHIVRTRTL